MTNLSSQQNQQSQYNQPRRNFQNNYRQQRPQQNRQYQQPANIVCYTCEQPGHIKRDCPTVNNNNNFNNQLINNNRQVPIINNIPIQQPANNQTTDQTKVL